LSVFATSWSGIAARTLRYANCDLQVRLDSSVIVLSRRNKRELRLSNASIPWLWSRSRHTNFIKMSSNASCLLSNQIGLTGNRLLRCKPLPEHRLRCPKSLQCRYADLRGLDTLRQDISTAWPPFLSKRFYHRRYSRCMQS